MKPLDDHALRRRPTAEKGRAISLIERTYARRAMLALRPATQPRANLVARVVDPNETVPARSDRMRLIFGFCRPCSYRFMTRVQMRRLGRLREPDPQFETPTPLLSNEKHPAFTLPANADLLSSGGKHLRTSLDPARTRVVGPAPRSVCAFPYGKRPGKLNIGKKHLFDPEQRTGLPLQRKAAWQEHVSLFVDIVELRFGNLQIASRTGPRQHGLWPAQARPRRSANALPDRCALARELLRHTVATRRRRGAWMAPG